MDSPVAVQKTMGSPISSSLEPFTNNDMIRSFLNGALWGGAAVGLLGAGAWLVSVMRTRSYIMPTAQRSANGGASDHHDYDEMNTHVLSH
jgi:hypothetical protein